MPVSINSDTGNIYAGGDGSDGDLVLRSSQGTNRVHLDAGGGNGWFGGSGADGDLILFPSSGAERPAHYRHHPLRRPGRKHLRGR
jgi:hypothetical protein